MAILLDFAGAVSTAGATNGVPQTVGVPVLERAWNHNTHYHRTLLRLVPDRCDRALDVGCGDGAFARRLATKSGAVVAIDVDQQQVDLARNSCADLENVCVSHADFLTAELGHASFDVVTALASLHHVPFSAAMDRTRDLLRPGGRLIVLGVWTDNVTARDHVLNNAAGLANKFFQRVWGPDVMNAPRPALRRPSSRCAGWRATWRRRQPCIVACCGATSWSGRSPLGETARRGSIGHMPSNDPPLPVVLLTGPPASGKSTVGRALARHLRAALVDQDTATAPLTAVVAELVGVDDLDDHRLAGPTRAARYETVAALAEDNLRVGTPVVLVAPFTAERRDVLAWDALGGRLRAAGGSPLLVWLRVRPSGGGPATARPRRASRRGQAGRRDCLHPGPRRRRTRGPARGGGRGGAVEDTVRDVIREVVAALPR